jgi:hypothetical protein
MAMQIAAFEHRSDNLVKTGGNRVNPPMKQAKLGGFNVDQITLARGAA